MLLKNYLDDFFNFFNCNLIHPTLLLVLFFHSTKIILENVFYKSFINSIIYSAILIYIIFIYLDNINIIYLVEKSHNRFMFGIVFSSIFMILFKNKYLLNKNIIYLFFLVIVIQFHSIGTNTILLNISSISIVTISTILICLLITTKFNKVTIIFITLISFVYSLHTVIVYQKEDYRRNLGHDHQNTVSIKSKTFKNLYIEKDLANTIDSLIENLIELNFDFNKDYIFGYPDIPGLLVGINCKSLGSSWKISGYNDSQKQIINDTIQSLNNLKNNDKVFLIIDENTTNDNKIINIIENRLSRSNDFKEVFSGEFFHHRNKKVFKCKIIGPYIKS